MSDKELTEQSDSTVSRNRLIGSIAWLLLLVIVVPIWYSNPVNFKPSNVLDKPANQSAVVERAFTLPESAKATDPVVPKVSQSPKTVTAVPAVAKKPDVIVPKVVDTQKTLPNKTATTPTKPEKFVWILRVVTYKNKDMAYEMKDRLNYDYEAFVKYFPETGYYSVRTGPYLDEKRAKKDQIKLNERLRVKSELVKIAPSDL